MNTSKRQRFKAGSVVKIELSEGRLAFGRLLPGIASRISIFDFIASNKDEVPSISNITNEPILFYCGVYRDIITKGVFEIIGFKEFTEEEIKMIPPTFTQDMIDIKDCVIFWIDGRERAATPHECIGLERSSVWEADGLKKRIEDHYAGRKNPYVELNKPILSVEDPRYLPPPQALKWDFKKQKYYRTDM